VIVVNVYDIHTTLARPNPKVKITVCMCDKDFLFFWKYGRRLQRDWPISIVRGGPSPTAFSRLFPRLLPHHNFSGG
jgi:hypothetical protein